MTDIIVKRTNSTIDIAKFVMAILVVAIHTEPFSFNIWLDRGFGIITRLCVPFFFIASSYFFFGSDRSLKEYLTRMLLLYFIWTIIFLPFDIDEFIRIGIVPALRRLLWDGNRIFWYLYATVLATILVVFLKRYLSNKAIIGVTISLLAVGCICSTYSPIIEKFGGGVITFVNRLGTRNGLFYAPAYVSIGMLIREKYSAKNDIKKDVIGFAISMILLVLESFLFVVIFETQQTILWLSVLPASYYLYRGLLTITIELPYSKSVFIRKLSTLIYLSHGLFLIAYGNMEPGMLYFLAVSVSSVALGTVIIVLSERIKILKYLY